MSQIDLAKATGFDRTYVSMLERSARYPSLAAVFQIAQALNLTAVEFVELVEAEEEFKGHDLE